MTQRVGMIGDTIFSAFNKQYLIGIMHVAHNIGWAIMGFLALKVNGSLTALLCAMAFNSTIICVIYLWIVFTKFTKPDFHLPFSMVSHLVRAALPIGLTAIFATAFQRIDRLLLSKFCGAYDVGLYSAAMTLIGPVIDLVWSSAIIVLYPYMASLYEDPERFKTFFRSVLTWIFTTMLGCVLVFVAFPDQIIGFAFGKKFEQSTYILALLSLQMIPLTFHGFLGRLLMVQHKQKAYGFANFAAFVANLALNLLLIRRFGLLGATISSLATNVLLIGFYMSFARVSLAGFVDIVMLAKIAFIGLISIGLARVMGSPHLFVSLAIFSAAYMTLAYFALNLSKEWTRITALLPQSSRPNS